MGMHWHGCPRVYVNVINDFRLYFSKEMRRAVLLRF